MARKRTPPEPNSRITALTNRSRVISGLEGALLQASQGEKEALASLQAFLRDFPKHPRVSEALVALAELAFHAAPPQLNEARGYLARAAKNAADRRSPPSAPII